MKNIVATICLTLGIILAALLLFTPKKCDHEEVGKVYSFQPNYSMAASDMKSYCKSCNRYLGYSAFRGTPKDQSYLEVVKEHITEGRLVPGGYCTVSATVSLGDYDTTRTRIRCQIESEGVIVGFSVEFREGYERAVASLREGDQITFRGSLYTTGFGWSGCELIE